MRPIIIILAIILLFSTTTLAYLEPSFRIKALGEDFVGIILDEYTDIFRNPAYLTLVENYKIFGEYRKDRPSVDLKNIAVQKIDFRKEPNRFLLVGVFPKFTFGKFAIISKGWQRRTTDLIQTAELFGFGNESVLYENSYENINENTLKNLGLIYATGLKENFNLGLDLVYMDDNVNFENQSNYKRQEFEIVSGRLLEKYSSENKSASSGTNKFFQVRGGIKFLLRETIDLDLTLSFKHLNFENTGNSRRFFLYEDYDTLGNVSFSQKEEDLDQNRGPLQKGYSYEIGIRISKKVVALENLNLLWRFSYTDWDTKLENQEIFTRNDTLIGSILQSSNNEDKNSIEMNLKLGLESQDVSKIKLYAGITNSLIWEKQTYPNFLIVQPTSKWRNVFYKISLPLAIEYTPFKKAILRYGASPNYTYSASDGFDANFNWISSTAKTSRVNNSFGYSYQVFRNLLTEGYILPSGDLLRIDNWMLGVSYSF